MRLVFLIFVSATFCFCSGTAKMSSNNSNQKLYKKWTHSHEDDQNDIKAYRPSDYDFPPARGRAGFEFKSDGTFIENRISPTDRGNRNISGKWERKSENEYYISFDDNEIQAYTITIVSLDKEILKLKIQY